MLTLGLTCKEEIPSVELGIAHIVEKTTEVNRQYNSSLRSDIVSGLNNLKRNAFRLESVRRSTRWNLGIYLGFNTSYQSLNTEYLEGGISGTGFLEWHYFQHFGIFAQLEIGQYTAKSTILSMNEGQLDLRSITSYGSMRYSGGIRFYYPFKYFDTSIGFSTGVFQVLGDTYTFASGLKHDLELGFWYNFFWIFDIGLAFKGSLWQFDSLSTGAETFTFINPTLVTELSALFTMRYKLL